MDELDDGELVLVPDCGHLPGLESPDGFRAAVVEWLDRSLGGSVDGY